MKNMWEKANFKFVNKHNQKSTFNFRDTPSSNWRYGGKVYKWIFDIELSTEFGKQYFSICLDETVFKDKSQCRNFLKNSNIPYESFEAYLSNDISKGLELGIMLPMKGPGFLIVPRKKGSQKGEVHKS